MDEIEIRGLRVLTNIGVHAWEQAIQQPLLVTVGLTTNLEPAGASDDLTQSIDYGAVAETIRDVCSARSYALIETVAANIADALLAGFATASVTVEVQKPGAVTAADTVLVRIRRPR